MIYMLDGPEQRAAEAPTTPEPAGGWQQEQVEAKAEHIAKDVADRCHGTRKPDAARQRYATIYQAARLGALAALTQPSTEQSENQS